MNAKQAQKIALAARAKKYKEETTKIVDKIIASITAMSDQGGLELEYDVNMNQDLLDIVIKTLRAKPYGYKVAHKTGSDARGQSSWNYLRISW